MKAELRLIEQVAATIARYRMFEPGHRVGVAVSGGVDSVCLLHVLRELAPRWNLRLTVLHLNHGLRGRESDEDAEFVRGLAAQFELPFLAAQAGLSPDAENLEQAARDARLAFFRDAMAEHGLNRVAVGHTRSDQAETVLFRLLRGAGTAGLAGIRPVTSIGIVRPLLEVDRAQVEPFLRERRATWREDSSNRSRQFARNRIRHELLPALAREWNPAIYNTLAQIADWALAEESYWDQEMNRLAAEHLVEQGPSILLQTDCLRELPLAAGRRLVRHAMESVKGDLRAVDFGHVNAVMDLAQATEGHGRLQAPGLDIMRSFNWLRFSVPVRNALEQRNYRVPVIVPGTVPVPGSTLAVSLQVIEKPEHSGLCNSVYNKEMVSVDWERLSGPLELRNWRPGDQYQPTGRAGAEKIKTLFQEYRVPLWERRHWPVLMDGEIIVWARRFGPAAGLAAGSGTRKLLQIQEIGIEQQRGSV